MKPKDTQPENQEMIPPIQSSQDLEMTPEMVKKIADMVYSELQRNLVLEHERSRWADRSRVPGIGRLQ